MNPAVECAERGDYKGFREVCEMFPGDWLTIYWKATCLSLGFGCKQDMAQGNRLTDEMMPSILALAEQGNVFVLVGGEKTESPYYFRNFWTNVLNSGVEHESCKIADLFTKAEKPKDTLC